MYNWSYSCKCCCTVMSKIVCVVYFFSFSVVTLYNCSLGREDCSLCKNTDFKYNCVWCARSRSCVFHKLCPSDEEQECPDPVISAVSSTPTRCTNNIHGINSRYIESSFFLFFSFLRRFSNKYCFVKLWFHLSSHRYLMIS